MAYNRLQQLIVEADRAASKKHGIQIPPAFLGRAYNDAEEKRLESALEYSWQYLRNLREKQPPSEDLTAVEHYAFARYFICCCWPSPLAFKLLILAYDGVKYILILAGKADWLRTGKHPPSRPTQLARYASAQGVDQGDYFWKIRKGVLLQLPGSQPFCGMISCPTYPGL